MVKKSSVKAIIFDCDGTLVDSEYSHYLSWKYAIEKQGKNFPIEEYYAYVGHSTENNAQTLANLIGKNCAQEIIQDKKAYFHNLQLKGIPPIQETINFVHRLFTEKEKWNFKLAVASAVTKEEILLNLRNVKIEHFFDLILSGCEDLSAYGDKENVNKPKPYIYLESAKILGVHPSECVVIEDSQSGVTSGSDAGCFTIAVPNSYSQKQDFSKAHLTIDSFMDMSVHHFLKKIFSL